MIKQLFIDFFNAIEEREFKTNKNAKTLFWVNELQEADYNDENYIGERKAKRYYEKYIEEKKDVSVKAPNNYQRNFIAEYLGFEDFEDFKKKSFEENSSTKGYNKTTIREKPTAEKELKTNTKKTSEKIFPFILKFKKQFFISSVFLLVLLFTYKYILFENSDCIIWKKNHFETTTCTTKGAIKNELYNIDIGLFKKATLTKDMEFFTNGKPNYWYGSNKDGKREFFTARGIHPETLKELAPITRAILQSEGLLNE
ncbi:hypothetical protein [Tenacibaculum aestuarii]|uniref:hypothetical protein n=1 Tax=Tenacibaculum aestuarii TaxID=362781 RepID=UPI003894C762